MTPAILYNPLADIAPQPEIAKPVLDDWFSRASKPGVNPLSLANDERVQRFLSSAFEPNAPIYDPEPDANPAPRLRDRAPPPRIEYRPDPRSSMRPR
ncbi:MAG: hypothetical protein ING19_16325 [Azospirillum sp.]|nr:hypothetical protein [Azospirillum sp.]